MPKYFAIVNAGDNNTLPTQNDPLPLRKIGSHLESFLQRYRAQGYFFNCRMERVPLDKLSFTIVQANASGGLFGKT